jgi:hypothetical protein
MVAVHQPVPCLGHGWRASAHRLRFPVLAAIANTRVLVVGKINCRHGESGIYTNERLRLAVSQRIEDCFSQRIRFE